MIEKGEYLRLLLHIVGSPPPTASSVEGFFKAQLKTGLTFTPDLDLQDIATLARIWAGEDMER